MNVDNVPSVEPSNDRIAPQRPSRWAWLNPFRNRSVSSDKLSDQPSIIHPKQEETVKPHEVDPPDVRIDSSGSLPDVDVVEPISKSSISTLLSEKLKQILDKVTPSKLESKGVPAIGTNERVQDGFFEAVRAVNPDGHIVGVGAATAFSLVHAFQEGVIPRSIVLSDIDPRVILHAKLIVEALKTSPTREDFIKSLFSMSEEQFQQKIAELINKEEDSTLKQRMAELSKDDLNIVMPFIDQDVLWKYDRVMKSYQSAVPFSEGATINVPMAILDRFDVLRQLAVGDNIAVAYADFTNPVFINAVKELPDFTDGVNIIYASNISDHFARSARYDEKVPDPVFPKNPDDNDGFIAAIKAHSAALKARNARAVERALQPMYALSTYWNDVKKPPIIIDTLTSLNYFLRARRQFPEITSRDYGKTYSNLNEKPEGIGFIDMSTSSQALGDPSQK